MPFPFLAALLPALASASTAAAGTAASALPAAAGTAATAAAPLAAGAAAAPAAASALLPGTAAGAAGATSALPAAAAAETAGMGAKALEMLGTARDVAGKVNTISSALGGPPTPPPGEFAGAGASNVGNLDAFVTSIFEKAGSRFGAGSTSIPGALSR